MAEELKAEDLRIDTYYAGEHSGFLHTDQTAVRITHLPTGVFVESKDERSVHANKQRCLDLLSESIASMNTRAQLPSQEAKAAPAQQQPQAVIEQGKARIAELERQTTMDGGLARLALNAAKDQLASAEAALDKAQALNVELRAQLKAKASVPDRMAVPKPLWKDARNPYGDPLNAADIRGAEMFNLAIGEVLRLNSAAAPAQPHSDAARYELLRARFDDCKSSQCELMQDFLKLVGEPHETLDALIDRALLGGEA